MASLGLEPDEIRTRVQARGEWFHNIDLNGVQTAPRHFLGNYPAVKWRSFAHALPADLSGRSVLDVGCNGGFYTIEMKRGGAERVLASDTSEVYLDQAQFGSPKLALKQFCDCTPEIGLCQWLHFEDHRLLDAVRWMRELGVRYLRTGLSWADSYRPDALAWFGRQMSALDGFDFTITFCFTPEHLGTALHHTSPPREHGLFAEFCAAMVRRYVRAGTAWGPVAIREVA